MTPTHFLSSHVGSGSDAHCMSGSAFTDATTSAGVTTENCRNIQLTGAGVKDGGSASAVAACTPAILLSKKLCRSDTLIPVDGGTRPRPSSSSTARHRRVWTRTQNASCEAVRSTGVVERATLQWPVGRCSTVVQHDGRLSPKHAALAWLYDSRHQTKLTSIDDGR